MKKGQGYKEVRMGVIQRKILHALLAWVSFALAPSPRKQWKVLQEFRKEWKEIDRGTLLRSITTLEKRKLVELSKHKSGWVEVRLSVSGRQMARKLSLDQIEIKRPPHWNRKWQVVLFDIPEQLKSSREGLRYHLRRLGFLEYQKSVFVFPYPCRTEIDQIKKALYIEKCVRYMVVDSLDGGSYLKKRFGI